MKSRKNTFVEVHGYAIRFNPCGLAKIHSRISSLLSQRQTVSRDGSVVTDLITKDGLYFGCLGKTNRILMPIQTGNSIISSSVKRGVLSILAPFCLDFENKLLVFITNDKDVDHWDFFRYFDLVNEKDAVILWAKSVDDSYSSRASKYVFKVDLFKSYNQPDDIATSADAYSTNILESKFACVSRDTREAKLLERVSIFLKKIKLLNKESTSNEALEGYDLSGVYVFCKRVENDNSQPVFQDIKSVHETLIQIMDSVKNNAFR